MGIWRVISLIGFPMKMAGLDENGNPPQTLTSSSRLDCSQEIVHGHAKLYLREVSDDILKKQFDLCGTQAEFVFLVCEVEAENLNDASVKSAIPIEWACDSLAFNLQYPILIHQTRYQDLAKPDEQTWYPVPFQPLKFRRFIRGNVKSKEKAGLTPMPNEFDERDVACLRWYHKALAAPYDVDKFAFLWISMEILSKNFDASVCATYTNYKCGHEIKECPECGESTEKEVNGKSLKKFLVEYLGISQSEANGLWDYRQMFHGNNKLTEKKAKKIHTNVTLLQAAVCKGLKIRLGLEPEDLPVVEFSGFTAQNGFGFGMQVTRQTNEPSHKK